MKLNLTELKKAVAWVEANTNEEFIKLEPDPEGLKRWFDIRVFDRESREVSIRLFTDNALRAKITRTETLK